MKFMQKKGEGGIKIRSQAIYSKVELNIIFVSKLNSITLCQLVYNLVASNVIFHSVPGYMTAVFMLK